MNLHVDGIDLFREAESVVIRLITPTRSYDVRLLPHHVVALSRAMMDTARP
jgi:hypothetical protein